MIESIKKVIGLTLHQYHINSTTYNVDLRGIPEEVKTFITTFINLHKQLEEILKVVDELRNECEQERQTCDLLRQEI